MVYISYGFFRRRVRITGGQVLVCCMQLS